MRTAETQRARAFVGPYALTWFYRRWLRVHAVQELLAGFGVAIAVALVFATIVAAGSIAGSAGEVDHTVIGPASLQLHARGSGGIPEALVKRVEGLEGVKQAAPLLEQTATVVGSNGQQTTVDLAGANLSLVVLDGLAHTIPRATLSAQGIGLSSTTAGKLSIPSSPAGVAPTAEVLLKLRGGAKRLHVSAVLGPEAFGALAQATVAVMQLSELQRLAGMQGRVSRILVVTQPGRAAAVRRELAALTEGRIDVAAANQDVGLLQQALRPSNQASAFFATISGLLGLLLATGALLLTAPERRRAVAELRLIGTRPSAIAQMFLFQALVLGVLAAIVGVLIGYGLSLSLLHSSPHYLAEAFTLGTHTVITTKPLLIALLGGVLSTCLASTIPLLELRRSDRLDGVYHDEGAPGNALGRRAQRRFALAAVTLLAIASVLYATVPGLALLACVLLASATVLAVPVALGKVLRGGRMLAARRQTLTVLPVALGHLRATTLRSLALSATGAVALFGSVALSGARSDLTHGIAGFARSYSQDAAIWIGNPSDDQAVVDFAPGDLSQRIAKVPGVAKVQAFEGGFLQLDGRRLWVIARPTGGAHEVLASQIVAGSTGLAERRLAAGGWIVVSQQVAEQHDTGIGGSLSLPTPSGERSFRIAALSTNLAWSPGVVFIGTGDYQRLWQSSAPTALGVSLTRDAQPAVVRKAVARTLGPSSGLQARTSAELQSSIDSLTGEGLRQLGEISMLLLLAAILAMAAALTSAIWQRRTSLAGLRLSGVSPARLRRILLTESALMLGAGSVTGALAGVYGQAVIDGYLARVTGFPVASVATGARPLAIFAIVIAVVLLIATGPVLAASRVSPRLAFNE
ncbi:MAG TPA: FtsX-like permease family protein [Solirubrobacteraceae bacterium]